MYPSLQNVPERGFTQNNIVARVPSHFLQDKQSSHSQMRHSTNRPRSSQISPEAQTARQLPKSRFTKFSSNNQPYFPNYGVPGLR